MRRKKKKEKRRRGERKTKKERKKGREKTRERKGGGSKQGEERPNTPPPPVGFRLASLTTPDTTFSLLIERRFFFEYKRHPSEGLVYFPCVKRKPRADQREFRRHGGGCNLAEEDCQWVEESVSSDTRLIKLVSFSFFFFFFFSDQSHSRFDISPHSR